MECIFSTLGLYSISCFVLQIFQSMMPSRCTGLSLPQTKSAPVPPSLIASPFLTLPVFNCAGAAPHVVTEQDNLWLQDTVPVSVRPSSSGQSGSLKHSDSRKHVQFPQSCPAAPSSPPIVISSLRESRRHGSTQSLDSYPLNHPSHFHLFPNHPRTLPPHPSSSSSSFSFSRGRHSRMCSDSDIAFVAKKEWRTM